MPSDPYSFDELKLPFIFVPHGEPEPTEWLARHPDYIKLPATFVPRTGGDDRSDPPSSGPRPAQRRSIDGLVTPGYPTTGEPVTANATRDSPSAGTGAASGRASFPGRSD
jgi:hypothetical protein